MDSINLRKRPAIYPLDVKAESYGNSFFPYRISQWNNLDSRIRNLSSIATFKRSFLDFIRPVPRPMFKINRLFDLIYSCHTNAVKNTEHYLLHCSNFANQRPVLFDELRNINIIYGPLDSLTLSRMLLFDNPTFSDNVNSSKITAVIKLIELTNRFSGSIYD